MFSPATVILVNCGPRLFKDKRCFRSPASRFVWTCSCSSNPTDKVQFQTAADSQTCYFAMFCFPSPPSHSQPCCSLAGLVLTIGCTKHSSSGFASWRATVLHMGQITWKMYSGLNLRNCLSALSCTAEVILSHTCPALTYVISQRIPW